MKKMGFVPVVFLFVFTSNPVFAQVENSFCCNKYSATTSIGYANPDTVDQHHNWAMGLTSTGYTFEKYGKNQSSWVLDVNPNYQSFLNIFDYMISAIFGSIFGYDPGPMSYSESLSLSYKKSGFLNKPGAFYRAGVEVYHIKSPGYSNELIAVLGAGYEWKRGHSVIGIEMSASTIPVNIWYKYRF